MPTQAEPYSVLAAGYDAVMQHVCYDAWAEYIYELIERHHPEGRTLLELGCGTASLALCLQPLGGYAYLATDRSPAMVRMARRKVEHEGLPVEVAEADFTSFEVAEPVDVVLLLYDGLNYLLELEEVELLLDCAASALPPGGIFLYDQSTPLNSLNNEEDFEDEGCHQGFAYRRTSNYDPDARRHVTRFEIEVRGERYREEHVQRAYRLEEIAGLVEKTPFRLEAVYDGFTREPAGEHSERAHWVLRRTGGG